MKCAFPGATLLYVAAASASLCACTSAADQAAEAAAQYELALAAGDTVSARNAILRAVQAKDDVAEYWMALARVQISLQQYADAYYAYVRAVELDRTNIEALQSLSEIALASGRVNEAEQYATQVELLDPSSLGALTTRGFIALRRRDFDEAIKKADAVMARVPLDPNAKILKARALQGKGADAESVRLLEDHLASRGGSDESMLAALLLIYRQQDNLPGIVQTGAKLLATKPADRKLQFEHARDLYRAKQASRARTIALALARSPEAGAYLADLLSLWLTHEDRQTSLEDARSLAPAARGRPRVLYARFFLEAGLPAEAEALLAPQASLPVTTGNADAIAVLGQAKLAQGKGQAGLALLDEVLAFDATNIQALRGRADHHRANRQFRQALRDTSRLVAENPSSAQDRLRLASLYISVGNLERAETTYWAAFRDIPGDARLYATLRAFLQRTGRSGDVSSVDKQYAEQKRILRSKLISA